MRRRFAQALADVLWPDLLAEVSPGRWHASSGLPDGRSLGFSEDLILLYPPEQRSAESTPLDGVVLDSLIHDRKAAEKLAGWLGLLFGDESGVHELDPLGWAAWAVRPEGDVVEASIVGFYRWGSWEAFKNREDCRHGA